MATAPTLPLLWRVDPVDLGSLQWPPDASFGESWRSPQTPCEHLPGVGGALTAPHRASY